MKVKMLAQLAGAARGTRRLLGVNTNGFWVRSKNIREMFATELAGISNLFISYSKWHASYIKPDEVAAAIHFALDHGRAVDLMLVWERSQIEVEEMVQSIFPAGPPSDIFIASGPLAPLGRARALDSLVPTPQAQDEPAGCSLVNRPTVTEDGSYLMCCNTVNFKAGAAALKVGSLELSSLEELMSRHSADPLVRAMRTLGPSFLQEVYSRLAPSENIRSCSSADKCERCLHLLQHERVAKTLREFLA